MLDYTVIRYKMEKLGKNLPCVSNNTLHTFVTTTMRSKPRFLARVSSGSGNNSSSMGPFERSEKL